MALLGFSTGALFRDALAEAVAAVRQLGLESVELSALRKRELANLVDFAETADLGAFKYVSVHAPTDYLANDEPAVADALSRLSRQHGWPVVVHPDCISNPALWQSLGERLCLENMDKRKPVGRTVEELRPLFERFPQARLCFDIAHAHQVDTSMTEAYRILREFGHRICQIHLSEVTSSSKHERISETALSAFLDVASLLPRTAPVILETPVDIRDAERELRMAARLFEPTRIAAGA